MERIEVRFRGRVQGVGFRYTSARIAERHDVTGWVRNEPDGTVRMQVQGASAVLANYLNELTRAMETNIVQADRTPAEPVVGERGFDIRR